MSTQLFANLLFNRKFARNESLMINRVLGYNISSKESPNGRNYREHPSINVSLYIMAIGRWGLRRERYVSGELLNKYQIMSLVLAGTSIYYVAWGDGTMHCGYEWTWKWKRWFSLSFLQVRHFCYILPSVSIKSAWYISL